jgi:hypothetical protein
MSAVIVATVIKKKLSIEKLRYAVVWTGGDPHNGKRPFDDDSHVMALFADPNQAEEWQKNQCPNAGLLCEVVEK